MPDTIDTDNICTKSPTGEHVPDWGSCSFDHDGDECYIDVLCLHCHKSGCLGSVKKLTENIDW